MAATVPTLRAPTPDTVEVVQQPQTVINININNIHITPAGKEQDPP